MACCGGELHDNYPRPVGIWSNSGSLGNAKPKKDDTDAYIADALHSLSLKDRDVVFHQVHGVAHEVEETPELLTESFVKLKETIRKCLSNCSGYGDGFRQAEQMDFEYVHSERFYKMFLRAERFDVEAAAVRMIRYFDFKLFAFGKDLLCEDLRQSMLTPADMDHFKKGFLQTVPQRDRTGRIITVAFPPLVEYSSLESLGRMLFYNTWLSAQDETTQRLGAVLVCFLVGDFTSKPVDTKQISVLAQSLHAAPVKFVVVHNCFNDKRFELFLKLGMPLLNKDSRARTKIHCGAPMECIYGLLGYGIPDQFLPVSMLGEVKKKQHTEFLKARKFKEEQDRRRGKNNIDGTSQEECILLPANTDVLLGRGKPIHSHQGNRALHRLVDEAIPEYETCRKSKKTTISQALVQQVKDEFGGRFLKQDPDFGVWWVVDDETARLKVSHLFRARRQSVLDSLAKPPPTFRLGSPFSEDSNGDSSQDTKRYRIS
eukprot:Nitzschia sp. Nitz4//scaffold90_size81538//688//2245//NITZ4_005309-RA/size81538-processed-gene-0.29-mRNA-1//1//CDS//3329559981//3938//frame0